MKTSTSKKLRVGLFGGSGKMGQEVESALVESSHISYLFVGRKPSPSFSFSVTNLKNIEDEILQEVDVWIDFSSAEGLFSLLKRTADTPVVSGSTGLSTEQFKQLKRISVKRPVFWASNMSVGLWAFRQALKSFSTVSDFDFSINEIHHNQKKDKPSGTALTLRDDLKKIVSKRIETPTAQRLGGVFGIHTVYAASANEIISFQHQALNRKVFATGAIQAAEWAIEQKNGFYSMDDMLTTGRFK